MIKIPYRILVPAIIVLIGAVMILPSISGSDGGSSEATESEKTIVVEKLSEDAITYLNKKYHFADSTQFIDIERAAIKPGTWLIIEDESEDGFSTLTSVKTVPDDEWTISGTIGSLIYDSENEIIGFTINDQTIFMEHHEGEDSHHVEVGMGVNVTVHRNSDDSGLVTSHFEVVRHHGLLHAMTLLMLQISVILFVAKIAGELMERYFKQPAVLGELIAGIIISPYALGGIINIPGVGSLFQTANLSTIMKASPLQPDFAVSPELWAIAQIAAIILLFMAGLETDLSRFLKYAGPATIIGLGGVITPFVLGIFATVWLIPGMHWMDPTPLFMGAIMVATSVGITARVLSDINRLDTSEGVTILAGAVIDDVLGILVLAIVNSIAMAELAGKAIDFMLIGEIAIKAILFWLGLTFIGILTSKHIEKFITWFKTKGATLGLGLSICFASAAAAELFGLAMIIGAYSIGLAMSDRDVAHFLEEKLTGAYNFVVPIFFVVMGMMVDVNAMLPLFWPYGVVISIFAVISKVFGCGLPALFVGFNKVGAWRIGVGMMPRGEVALIIAGVGIANGIIATDMFGVAILLTLVTTILAPPLLVPAFKRGGEGTVAGVAEMAEEKEPSVQTEGPLMVIELKSENHQRLLKEALLESMRLKGFEMIFSDERRGIYETQKDGKLVAIALKTSADDIPTLTIDAVTGTEPLIIETLKDVTNLMDDYKNHILDKLASME